MQCPCFVLSRPTRLLKFGLLLHNGVHHIKVCWNYVFCFLLMIAFFSAALIYTPCTHALHFRVVYRTGVMRVQCLRLNPAPLFLAAPCCYWEELFLCRYPLQKKGRPVVKYSEIPLRKPCINRNASGHY